MVIGFDDWSIAQRGKRRLVQLKVKQSFTELRDDNFIVNQRGSIANLGVSRTNLRKWKGRDTTIRIATPSKNKVVAQMCPQFQFAD